MSLAPFRELHTWQAGTMLSFVCGPNIATGIKWSLVNLTEADPGTTVRAGVMK